MRQNHQSNLMLKHQLSQAEESVAAYAGLADQIAQGKGEASLGLGPQAAPNQPLTEVEQAQIVLDSLRSRYSENHPDVRRAVTELERLKRIEAAAASQHSEGQPGTEPSSGSSVAPLPQHAGAGGTQAFLEETLRQHRERAESLRVQLKINEQELKALNQEKGQVLADISRTEARVGSLPIREQELAKVVRDYEISKTNYHSLLDKRMEADVAANMETRQKAERFSVLDRARIPEKPVRPDRPLLIAIGSSLGLMFGIFLGFGIELKNGVLLGEWELPSNTPVLGRVPPITLAATHPQRPSSQPAGPSGRRVRVQAPRWRLVVVPTLFLCLLGALIVTSVYTGWSPF